MKVTFYREYSCDMNYRDEYDLELSDEEHHLILTGEHPEYESLEEWAADEWGKFQEPTRRETYLGDYFCSGEEGVV